MVFRPFLLLPAQFWVQAYSKTPFITSWYRLITFVFDLLLCSAFLKLSWLAGSGWGWVENRILMKIQSSAWTWTLDFDLWFVNIKPKHIYNMFLAEMVIISFNQITNPPTQPDKYEGDRIEQNLENKSCCLFE